MLEMVVSSDGRSWFFLGVHWSLTSLSMSFYFVVSEQQKIELTFMTKFMMFHDVSRGYVWYSYYIHHFSSRFFKKPYVEAAPLIARRVPKVGFSERIWLVRSRISVLLSSFLVFFILQRSSFCKDTLFFSTIFLVVGSIPFVGAASIGNSRQELFFCKSQVETHRKKSATLESNKKHHRLIQLGKL